MADINVNAVAALISEVNTKINDIEGRHELLKERVIVSNEGFIKSRDSLIKEINLLKEEIRQIKTKIDNLQESLQYLLAESSTFARKEELRILEKYMKLWEPLKFARMEDVKEMINDAVKGIKEGQK